jgi:phage baseplate assembly protein W
MKSEGNSNVQVCIDNLLKTIKGEVPYARDKGIEGGIVDMPLDEAEVELAASADECIDTYEPRVDIEDIDVNVLTENGNLTYDVDVSPMDEDDTAYVDDEDDEEEG